MHKIKKGAPKGELTLRTSVITHGSKGELALRDTFFIWCTRAFHPGLAKLVSYIGGAILSIRISLVN